MYISREFSERCNKIGWENNVGKKQMVDNIGRDFIVMTSILRHHNIGTSLHAEWKRSNLVE